jgi:hypothetical protein
LLQSEASLLENAKQVGQQEFVDWKVLLHTTFQMDNFAGN